MKNKPAVSRKAVSVARANELPTWEELNRLARSRKKFRPLVDTLAKGCVWFLNALHKAGKCLRYNGGCAEAIALYERARERFVSWIETLREKWRQIDSRRVFYWDPNLYGLFAKKIANGFVGVA